MNTPNAEQEVKLEYTTYESTLWATYEVPLIVAYRKIKNASANATLVREQIDTF